MVPIDHWISLFTSKYGRIRTFFQMLMSACVDGTTSCVPDATCTNTEGGYICQCGFGYNGDHGGRSSGTGCISESMITSSLLKLLERKIPQPNQLTSSN